MKILIYNNKGIYSNMQCWFNSRKSINIIHHIQKLTRKKSYDHIRWFRKIISQNLVPIHDKTFRKLGTEDNFFNLIKSMYIKTTASTTLNVEKLNYFPLRLRMRQNYTLSPFFFSTEPEFQASATMQEK